MKISRPYRRSPPLVSIGMAVHNCQETLPAALRSILLQSYTNWELLLIDDGSEDNTVSVAGRFKDPRIKLIHSEENLGLPTQLNRALSLSRGAYFARMDGDDLSYPMRIEKQVDFLNARPDVDLLGTGVLVFGKDGYALGKRTGPLDHAAICARPWTGFLVTHPTYMGRMEWFKRFGYHDVLRAEDQDLLLRAYQTSKFANLPEILLGYREENLNLTKILTSRKYFGRASFKHFWRQKNLPLAFRAILEQNLKGLVDIFATISGLKYKILSHRAASISSAEAMEWKQVWDSIQYQCQKHE